MSYFGGSGMNVIGWPLGRLKAGVKLIAAGCLLFQVASAQAVSLIQDIKFSALPGDKFEVKLDFDGPAPEPKSYKIDSPARIVLDFENTDSALSEKKYPLSFDNAQSVVVLSAGGRTRLIVNLRETVAYETHSNANSLTLAVGGAATAGSVSATNKPGMAASSVQQAAAGKSFSQSENAVKNVDFKRGQKGEGLVSIDLSNARTPVDVARVGTDITVSFYRTDLPEALNRKLDVVDFATPINSVDAQHDGATTRIIIAATGEYDYLAYQADNQYVVSVKPLTAQEKEQKSKFEYAGEKLSLNFQDIEVRSVLQLIADFTDLNLVASDTVTGNITLRLQNVPWDQALSIVLKAKGLDKRQEGNVLMVAPAVEIAEQERLRVEANKQLIELAPLVTDFVRVRYADAVELFELFDSKDGGGGGGGGGDRNTTSSILSQRGTAIVDQRTNTIILTDVQEKIDEFRRLVAEIDIPIRQVEIEARIIIASTDFRKEIGVRWGISGIRRPGDDILSFVGTRQGQKAEGVIDAFSIDESEIERDDFGNITKVENDHDLTLGESLAVDLGVSGPAGSFSLGLLKDNTFIDMELSALENDGFGEIISQPKVLTGDKQKAIIKAGTEIAYQSGTSSGATEVEFKEAVLKLEVTPQITPDNRIIMDLLINQDSVGQIVPTAQGGAEPTIDVTQIQTQALVGDGQTLVLGGIFQMEEIKGEQKVPVLGDIPFIGRLFKNTVSDRTKREILIFVTPRIISDPLLDQ